MFIPENRTGARARGITNANGKYVLLDESELPGVNTGEYRVIFSKLVVGSKEQTDPIPDVYQTEAKTPVKAVVNEKTNELNFDLNPGKPN